MRSQSTLPDQTTHRMILSFDVDSVTPAPLQLSQYAYLNADHTSVFHVISDHASLHLYSRAIKRIEVQNPDGGCDRVGVGTSRYCYTPAGLTLKESIVCWEPGRMYGYMIKNLPVILPNHLSVMLTEPTQKGNTLLTCHTYFEGSMIGGTFARITLGIVLPDMIKNLAKHFNGQVLSKPRISSYLRSVHDDLLMEYA